MSSSSPAFIYSLSSKRNLVLHTVRSIRTLRNHVPNAEIIVFYTPPRNQDDREVLEELDVKIRERPNIGSSFATNAANSPSHYGSKIHLCDVDRETVIFLDCDTIILDDPRKLINQNFDFRARSEEFLLNKDEWQNLFNEFDQPYVTWMPNCGVLVFTNGMHREIKGVWMENLENVIDFGFQTDVAFHGEQYALALSIGEYNIDKLNPHEHVMEFSDSVRSDGIVHHLDTGQDGSPVPEIIRVPLIKTTRFIQNAGWKLGIADQPRP